MKRLLRSVTLLTILFSFYRRYHSWFDACMHVFWTLVDTNKYPTVNGVKASQAQLDLAEQLGSKYVNYRIGKRYADIAFPKDRLVVEYNGAKFHPNKAADLKRARELTRRGWKVLIIQVYNGTPNAGWVKQQMSKLKSYKRRNILYVEWK